MIIWAHFTSGIETTGSNLEVFYWLMNEVAFLTTDDQYSKGSKIRSLPIQINGELKIIFSMSLKLHVRFQL